MIRILLADDQSLIRRGLRALLKTDSELEVIGEAENGKEAIALTETLQPDIVIMDIRMPIMDGVAATQVICQRFLIKVLILTTFDDQDYVNQALQYGASGYLLKDTPFEELTQTIRLVHKGYTQIGPGLAPNLQRQRSSELSPNILTALTDLTPKDLQIITFIAQGYSNREIAKALYIAEKTVKNRITNILSILNLRDRTQLAIMALQKE
jgi:DNA-binding NarL/FixJ family response regulator